MTANETLFTDHQYPFHIKLVYDDQPPLMPVGSQRSWQDCIDNRVRWQLQNMLPHDFTTIEGVEVERRSNGMGYVLAWAVDRQPATSDLARAVAAVCKVASEREAGK